MFKGIMNIASMMRQAGEISGRMKEINEKLKHDRATGNAGGGLVEATVNGLGEVISVSIDPSLIGKGDREMIEDLIPLAVNQAIGKSNELRMKSMQSIAGDMDLSGMQDALSKFMGPS